MRLGLLIWTSITQPMICGGKVKRKDMYSDGLTFIFDAESGTIGRKEGATFKILEALGSVSAEHLTFRRAGEQVFVTDVGSALGTTFDGRKLQAETELIAGKLLQLGTGDGAAVFTVVEIEEAVK